MTYKEITGNLITLSRNGMFDVIGHGCNCFCAMGAGIAPQMADNFWCHMFTMEGDEYRGDINKLGSIDYEDMLISPTAVAYYGGEDVKDGTYVVTVINCYTQYGFGRNHDDGVDIPLDYEALTLCMRKINHKFKGKHVGLPKIGCGLAGGDWEQVKLIIQKELKDCDVTIVIYDK